jgi:transposase
VFLDESGVTIAMTRARARSRRGTRVADSVPRNRGQVLTVLGAIRPDGTTVLATIDAGTSGDVFLAFLDDVLLPELRSGDIVVMDNLGAHKLDQVRARIEARGARIHWTPPYSPEYNPIELYWAWLKDRLRTAKARTRDELDQAIKVADGQLPKPFAESWTRHCGYTARRS